MGHVLRAPRRRAPAGPWRAVAPAELAGLLRGRSDPRPGGGPFVVAVDGRGGAGKSTLSALLAGTSRAAAVVHTDDIAWHEPLFEWGGMLAEGVLGPLRRGRPVSFRPPAWIARGRSGAIVVGADVELVVVEGVGAAQRAVADLLDAVVWVQSDFAEAERRGIARDVATGVNGDVEEATRFWHEWMAAELAFQARERPWERADVIVCGTPDSPADGGPVILIADGPLRPDGSSAADPNA